MLIKGANGHTLYCLGVQRGYRVKKGVEIIIKEEIYNKVIQFEAINLRSQYTIYYVIKI